MQNLSAESLFRRIYKSYTFKTFAGGLLTIWAVITFTFFLVRFMPGDPISIKVEQLIRSQNLTLEQAEQQAMAMLNYNPDTPLVEQYVNYMANLLRGSLGESITSTGTKVTDQIMRYLPWTLLSVGLGLLISFSLGIMIGTMMAYWRGGILDNTMTVFASIMYGIPDYVIALLMIIVVGVQLKILPFAKMLGGSTPGLQPGFTLEYIGDILFHAFLPVFTYVLSSVGGWILTMKSSTLATLGEDYITVARARGLSERRLLFAYVGRNAMLPLVTRLAISVGFIVGGSVIIETLYQYPGVGKALAEATGKRDYTTIQGFFLVIAVAVIMSNIVADLLFGLLDPRVRLGKEDAA